MMKKVLGMGNALTDILLRIDSDLVLEELNLPKGSMQLIDLQKLDEIRGKLNFESSVMATGGSASNTINGITKLGTEAGFLGKVGRDEIGDFFQNDLVANGVYSLMGYSTNPSGNCTVLVSPDGERTLCTFLGAAAELDESDINESIFSGYDIFHIEGYLVQNHSLIRKAVQMAKKAGLMVSIDLASYNVVESNHTFLLEMVKEYVDIVFANEEEARAFTGMEPREALIQIADHCLISVVKIGKKGSFVKSGEEIHTIEPFLATSIDTTGAGDLYAAGFLYGLANNLPLDVCGKIGSLVSSKVVEVLGAKMSQSVWNELKTQISVFVASNK
ncbi:MAG: adenosine kinase [Paludibacter sp.]|jgi:sugar/nucleoside kinase (ribokinase family)|nr:adenosine kinase [Paludibacter sp.]